MKIINFKFAFLIFLAWLITLNIASAQAIVIDENSEIAKKYAQEQIIPGSYIVVLSTELAKSGSPKEMISTKYSIQKLKQKYDFEVTAIYSYATKGFAAKMSADTAERLTKDPQVKMVDPDRSMQLLAQTHPWGVVRIGGAGSSTLTNNGSGDVKDVDIFIMDSGIDTTHPDLNVVGGKNFVTSGGLPGIPAWQDLHGHGTHVAGIAAAKDNSSDVVGVAPGANLYALRVVTGFVSGSLADTNSAVDWVTQVWLSRRSSCPKFDIDNPNSRMAQKKSNSPKYIYSICRHMVVNMSIGSFVNKSSLNVVDIAVKNSVKAGVFYAIAAGNSFNFNGAWYVAEAKYWSPAHVIEATTVSSYDNSNIFNKNTLPLNEYVSFGSFVDILAPGYNVESTKLGGGITSMTGSSMATPHVTGAAALYLSKHYYSRNGSFKALTTPQQVLIALKSSALAPKTGFPNSAITINSVGTPTLGVYTANH